MKIFGLYLCFILGLWPTISAVPPESPKHLLRPELVRVKSNSNTRPDQFELPDLELILFRFGAQDQVQLWKGSMTHTTNYKNPDEGSSIVDYWSAWNLDDVIDSYLEAKELRITTTVSRPIDGAYYSWRFIPHASLPEISGYLVDTTSLNTSKSEEVARQFSDLKTTLFRVLSHLVRNPLYQLTMQLQLVHEKLPVLKATRKSTLTTEQGRTLTFQSVMNEMNQHITQSQTHVSDVLRVSNLIEDYIAFEDKQLVLHQSCFDIVGLVQELWHEWREVAKHRQITLELEIEPLVEGRHPSITNDKIRIKKALVSVLENAIQHTEQDGEIFFHLALDRHEIILTVLDSGSGMEISALEDLRQRLQSGTISFHQDASVGLGISLALTYHAVVNMMKGQFHIRSLRAATTSGGDATPTSDGFKLPMFSFRDGLSVGMAVQIQIPLPDDSVAFFSSRTPPIADIRRASVFSRFSSHVGPSTTAENQLSYNGIPLSIPTRQYILVVDDDKVNLKFLVKLLQKEGHTHIFQAADGQEASNIYQRNYKTIRIVLTDLQMPVSGQELALKIRTYEKTFRLNVPMPIVAVTAAGAGSELRKECLDCGMSDLLSKPITKQDIQLVITKFAL